MKLFWESMLCWFSDRWFMVVVPSWFSSWLQVCWYFSWSRDWSWLTWLVWAVWLRFDDWRFFLHSKMLWLLFLLVQVISHSLIIMILVTMVVVDFVFSFVDLFFSLICLFALFYFCRWLIFRDGIMRSMN